MAANPIHVDHVRRHLDDAFGRHIDVDDIKNQPEAKLAEARRSRAPELLPEYTGSVSRPRSESAVRTIYNYQAIEPGTKIEFRAQTARERKLLNKWLNAEPTRRFASYVPTESKVLRWEHDDGTYTATGLTNKIWREATGKEDRSIQGTLYWYVAGRGTLVDIAEDARCDHDGSDAS